MFLIFCWARLVRNRLRFLWRRYIERVQVDYETVMFAGYPTNDGINKIVQEFQAKGYHQVQPRCLCCSLAFERRVPLRRRSWRLTQIRRLQ